MRAALVAAGFTALDSGTYPNPNPSDGGTNPNPSDGGATPSEVLDRAAPDEL